MGILDSLFGKKPKIHQAPRFTGEQQSVLDQLLGQTSQAMPQGIDFLQQLFTPGSESLEAFQAPAMRQFQEEILPEISQRFANTGSLSSSAFRNQATQAGASLAERLAAQRTEAGLQGFQQLLPLLQAGLEPRFQNVQTPGTRGILGGLLGGLAGSPLGGALQDFGIRKMGLGGAANYGQYGGY